jgi:small subunit ribosomal protein S2
MAVKISLKELIESGAHFGHQSRRWNPKMEQFLFGEQEGNHIFDLIKTKSALEEALNVITQASREGKGILLLGTKKQAKEKVEEVGKDAGIFYVSERWLGGTLTNFDQIRKSIRKLTDLTEKTAAGEFKNYTKKERLLIEREIIRLERFFGGISTMTKLPDLLIVVDIKKEFTAVNEATMKGVETIGIVDSNADPDLVDYPIPMNDDATRAVDYVLDLIKQAVLEGKKGTSKKSTTSKTSKK